MYCNKLSPMWCHTQAPSVRLDLLRLCEERSDVAICLLALWFPKMTTNMLTDWFPVNTNNPHPRLPSVSLRAQVADPHYLPSARIYDPSFASLTGKGFYYPDRAGVLGAKPPRGTEHGTLPSKIPARSACGKVSQAHKSMKPSAKTRNRQACRYDRFRHRARSVAICISFYKPEKLQTATPHRYHPGLVATLVILSLFCEESFFY